MAFNLPAALSALRFPHATSRGEKKGDASPPQKETCKYHIYLSSALSPSLSSSPSPSLSFCMHIFLHTLFCDHCRYPCQLLYHFNEYSPGNGLISVPKYLFLSAVDLVCLKCTGLLKALVRPTDSPALDGSALCSSTAMMLSATS